ncbi:MAG: DNA repair protein RecO [bacterium]
MPESVQTHAFVLRTVAYGDNDVIVTLLGRTTGRISAIARSARANSKRFSGCLEPLRTIDATVSVRPNRDLGSLTNASVLHDYPGLETSYERITVASYVTELVRACTREGADAQDVYDLLASTYVHLATCEMLPEVLQAITHHFELQLLDLNGAAPSLDGCHRCGCVIDAMDKLRCSRNGEGLLCASCLQPQERYGVLDERTLASLRYLVDPQGAVPDGLANDDVMAQVRRVIDSSLERLLDSEIRSRPMLDSLFLKAAL